jgi:hypothetical protein
MPPSLIKHAPLLLLTALPRGDCAPAVSPSSAQIANVNYGPIPGESLLYSNYYGITPPFPGNTTGAVLNTTSGPAAPNDLLFQNILGAEWTIFNFYQQGVEKFNTTSFTSAGFPNTTYQRIQQIRNNEAGHLRIFQDQISTNSIKPGPCSYQYPFTDANSFLALQTIIEVSSMAFVSGMEYESMNPASASVLVAIGETESRHNTWSLIDVWNASPFAGPADTVFPYANQLLDFTKAFIVPGSCPSQNPIYPNPPQTLAPFSVASDTKSIAPGSHITFNFTSADLQPHFAPDKEYHAVFFHGVYNKSMPFDVKTNSSIIPADFEPLGIIIAVIADEKGAPKNTSVIAGPTTFLEYPAVIGLELAIG